MYHTLIATQISTAESTLLFRPHHSNMYVDAAHCYRRSSVVCQCVSLSVTIESPAKTAEPIEMPFGLWIQVGAGNHVLDGGPVPHGKGKLRRGEEAARCKYTEYRPCAATMRPFIK